MITLSVIIPVYNAEKFLTEAVESVLKQPCRDVEIIIVNDGSIDNSGAIAIELEKKYEKVKVIHSVNQGVSHARNLGIEASCGQYLAFLDADDVWCKNVYTEEIKQQLLCREYDILSFGYFKTDEKLKKGMKYPGGSGCIERSDGNYDYYATRNHFSAYIYASHLFEKVRFPEGIRYGEDLSFQFLITRIAKKILMSDKIWFMYRTNSNSVMNSVNDFDYALGEIDGWHVAKKYALTEQDCLDCDAMIYRRMYKYLSLSCKNGKSYEKLYQDMLNCKPYQEALKTFDRYQVPENNVQFIEQFTQNPRKTWYDIRKKYFIRYVIRPFVRKTFLKNIILKMKYKTDLTQYRVE